jgi:hypothetical protein
VPRRPAETPQGLEWGSSHKGGGAGPQGKAGHRQEQADTRGSAEIAVDM